MPLVAEVVDAVVGGDTHRDTHALELTALDGEFSGVGRGLAGHGGAVGGVAKRTP